MVPALDRNGIELIPGCTVKAPTGHVSKIVYANCALRFQIPGYNNLDRNGSLVFCERWKPADFEVIDD